MRLLANENIPLATIRKLRELGHDVFAIRERNAGISDQDVLELAHNEQRILITFDSDYGELIYVRHLPCPAAVVYLRFAPAHPEEAAERLIQLIGAENTLEGCFIVLDREGYRRRSLPETK